ncbi:myo-inositol oxygenase [Acrasis kona]|uniref:Inositol oxygenase n=1 Tax=Acrasis kona TaxID=1008807 RepID=A0AAW2ZSH2_9EUKA
MTTSEVTDVSQDTYEHEYRNYVDGERQKTVSALYKQNHEKQTLEFVLEQKKIVADRLASREYTMTMWDALKLLDTLVDESDPDTSSAQTVHAFQTAEAIRLVHPDNDWLQLIGLLHDMGKMLCFTLKLEQWAVVGDTFPVGCKHDPSIVFHEFFVNNPDTKNPKLSTEDGIYQKGCGFDNVHFSYGHDEYFYQVCVNNKCLLPEEALTIIRYHSFYPWHNKGAYKHLENEKDRRNMHWILEFNKFDLYSKRPELPAMSELMSYYGAILKKYFPVEELAW